MRWYLPVVKDLKENSYLQQQNAIRKKVFATTICDGNNCHKNIEVICDGKMPWRKGFCNSYLQRQKLLQENIELICDNGKMPWEKGFCNGINHHK